jgi:hypothetical protein
VLAHDAASVDFAREFTEAWGGKRGRIVELTREDLDREWADEYERANARGDAR